jgi:hypothetical protein
MENVTNERLEFLSDKVRKGEPVDFFEAIEVIAYQERLKKQKKQNKFIQFFKRWFK